MTIAPHVLLINVHATDNAGDAALLEMGLRAIQDGLPGCHVTVAMNAPDARYASPERSVEVVPSFIAALPASSAPSVRRVLGLVAAAGQTLASAVVWRFLRRLPPLPNRALRRLLEQYAAADLVVSCPGNIFASTGKVGLSILQSGVVIAIALLMGKPVYVLPQSIGPLKQPWQRAIVSALYRRARVVMAREPVSFRFAQRLGIPPERLHLVPDLAFAYPPPSADAVPRRLRTLLDELPRPVVGVTAINRLLSAVGNEVWTAYERGLAEGLTSFAARHGGSVVFFPQVTGPAESEDDRIAARRIRGQMPAELPVLLVEDRLSPGQLKAMYATTDLFAGTRMHSLIFAISSGVPSLCIEYLAKTRGLAEMLDLERWRLDLAAVTEENVAGALDGLWDQRAAVRVALAARLSDLVDAPRQAAALIRSDWDGRRN